MVKLRMYQVDAFTRKVFSGNPAAVLPLDDWLADPILQRIATENNLSETAFIVPRLLEMLILRLTMVDQTY